MNRPLRWWTAAVIMFCLMIGLAWDIFAFGSGGMDATVSSIISGWLGMTDNPLPAFAAGFVCGGLLVHFTGWSMERPHRSE